MKIEPVPVEYMKDKNIWGKTTPDQETDICTVLRAIYHRTHDEDIKLRCRVATAMATRMRIKLQKYKVMLGDTE